MHETMPENEDDKACERLENAIRSYQKTMAETKHLKQRSSIQKPNESYAKLLGKPALLRSTVKRLSANKAELETIKLKTLASLQPQEILLDHHNNTPREFDGAIMIADVSGFTELSEKYNKIGKGGASKLSSVLNAYLGSMVSEILSHEGDVLKFAGDAIMALFKCTSNVNMLRAVRNALDTALIIQTSLSEYQTDVGVILKTKIAISAGRVMFSVIGENYLHYVLIGEALWDAKFCESLSKSGQVIVSSNAIKFVNKNEYICHYIEDHDVYLVAGFSDSWRMINRRLNDRIVNLKEDGREQGDTETIVLTTTISYLNHFLIPPIKRSIDLNEELEYLNEMRKIVVVFVNLVVEALDNLKLVECCDATFTKINRITESYEGTLNKVSLFDKDMMYLIIFGLRGFKHNLQSQTALRCAAEIQINMSKCDHVLSVSAGVVSGDTYCGIVGNETRREYSVIGVPVNKAARLMMSYPNKVTCDRKTRIESHMSRDNFAELSVHDLKGLKNVGPIYEFLEVFKPYIEVVPPANVNLLFGRDEEMATFITALEKTSKISKENKSFMDEQKYKTTLLITGDIRQGKTCLLDNMFSFVYQKHYNCFKITTHINQVRNTHFLTFLYLNHAMGLKEESTRLERERIIIETLGDKEPAYLYFYLNEILKVQFPAASNAEMDKKQIEKILFKSLCKQLFTKDTFTVIFIDDIEFADEDSILLLNGLLQIPHVFLVLTSGNKRRISEEASKILKHPQLHVIRLNPIQKMYHSALACQFLAVDGLDLNIERVIHLKSSGNPGWIKTFLTTSIHENIILLKDMTVEEAMTAGYILEAAVPKNHLNSSPNQNHDITNTNALDFCITDDATFYPSIVHGVNFEPIKIATFAPDINIHDLEVEAPEDNQFIVLYDSLNVYEQQILKCSAVLGKVFLRSMLLYVLQVPEKQVALALQKLFELCIFVCGRENVSQGNVIHQKPNQTNADYAKCFCTHLKISDTCKYLPQYAHCGYIRFKSQRFMNTSYDLLTDQQRKEYHTKAIIYLENESKTCEACGCKYFMNLALNERYLRPDVNGEVSKNFGSVTKQPELKSITKGIEQNSTESIKSSSEKTERTVLQFGSFSFSNCECSRILDFTYQNLARHANAAGLHQKFVQTKIFEAGNAVNTGHYIKCLTILEELQPLITEYFMEESHGYFVYFSAQVSIYRGKCNYYLQQYNHARKDFKTASNILRTQFPKSNISNVSEACAIAKKTKKFLKKSTYGAKATKVTLIYELISEQIAELYAAMYELFKKNKEYNLCATAASISLYKAVKYSHNHTLILDCYANFLLLAFHLGFSHKLEWMQIKSFELAINALKENVEQKLLLAISNLFNALMLCLAPFDKKEMGINLGYMTLQLNKAAGIVSHQWKVIPLLVAFLMTQKRIHDCVLLLTQFEIVMKENNDLTGLAWYYALCMDILLDTSVTIVSYAKCKKFYMENIELLSIVNDHEASARFYANMWLWCARTSNWTVGHLFHEKVEVLHSLSPNDSPMMVMTSLRIFESLILSLLKAINARDMKLAKIKEQEICRLMNSIKKAVNTTKVHISRFMLLKTYFSKVRNSNINWMLLLQNSARHSLKIESYLVYDMIEHNFRVWCKCEPDKIEQFWLQHCNGQSAYTQKEWLENGNIIYPYSLPIPNVAFT